MDLKVSGSFFGSVRCFWSQLLVIKCGSVLQVISRASQLTIMEGEEAEVEASLQDTLLFWVVEQEVEEEQPNTVRRTFIQSVYSRCLSELKYSDSVFLSRK